MKYKIDYKDNPTKISCQVTLMHLVGVRRESDRLSLPLSQPARITRRVTTTEHTRYNHTFRYTILELSK